MYEQLQLKLTKGELSTLRFAETMDFKKPVSSGQVAVLVLILVAIVSAQFVLPESIQQVLFVDIYDKVINLLWIALFLALLVRLYMASSLIRKLASLAAEASVGETRSQEEA